MWSLVKKSTEMNQTLLWDLLQTQSSEIDHIKDQSRTKKSQKRKLGANWRMTRVLSSVGIVMNTIIIKPMHNIKEGLEISKHISWWDLKRIDPECEQSIGIMCIGFRSIISNSSNELIKRYVSGEFGDVYLGDDEPLKLWPKEMLNVKGICVVVAWGQTYSKFEKKSIVHRAVVCWRMCCCFWLQQLEDYQRSYGSSSR